MANTNTYINIDNVENDTSTWSTYLTGNEDKLDCTKISMEIPIVLTDTGAVLTQTETDDYWKSETLYCTKLATHNVFKTKYMRRANTLSVYIDSKKLSTNDYTIIDALRFSINESVSDGYLWVSYYPDLTGSNYPFGDLHTQLTAAYKPTITDHKLPLFDTALIVRIRKVINNVELYYGISPTVWLGGFSNDILSSSENIIPGITTVCSDHITELQYALKRIIKYMISMPMMPINVAKDFSTITFTAVTDNTVLSLSVLSEIIRTLYKIELEISLLANGSNS